MNRMRVLNYLLIQNRSLPRERHVFSKWTNIPVGQRSWDSQDLWVRSCICLFVLLTFQSSATMTGYSLRLGLPPFQGLLKAYSVQLEPFYPIACALT